MDFIVGILVSISDEENNSKVLRHPDLEIAYYMPYLSLDARFYPMPSGMFNPYLIGGIGYNYLMLDVMIEDKAEAGVSYDSVSLKLGAGVDVKFTRGFGIGIEYDLMGTSMELTKAGDDTEIFERAGLKKFDLDNGFLKIQLNFYSRN